MKRKKTQQKAEIQAVLKLPNSLQELIVYYTQGQGKVSLGDIQLGARPVFIGSGVDLMAAKYAARLCMQAGMKVAVYSKAEIESYPADLLLDASSFVIFGDPLPAGMTDEVKHSPCFRLAADVDGSEDHLYLTNFADAQLGKLGLINSMALAWLLVRQATGEWDGTENAKLRPVRQRAQLMADGCDAFLARCRDLLKYSPRWILVGGEEQREAMQFTSLLLAKEANHLVPWVIYEDYAEYYQQHVDPDTALIHLRGVEDPRIDILLDQAEEKGAVVVDVTEGFFAPHRSQKNFGQAGMPNLIPLLGCMAGNILALSDQIEVA